jgi:hypothetical protein
MLRQEWLCGPTITINVTLMSKFGELYRCEGRLMSYLIHVQHIPCWALNFTYCGFPSGAGVVAQALCGTLSQRECFTYPPTAPSSFAVSHANCSSHAAEQCQGALSRDPRVSFVSNEVTKRDGRRTWFSVKHDSGRAYRRRAPAFRDLLLRSPKRGVSFRWPDRDRRFVASHNPPHRIFLVRLLHFAHFSKCLQGFHLLPAHSSTRSNSKASATTKPRFAVACSWLKISVLEVRSFARAPATRRGKNRSTPETPSPNIS